LARLLICAQPRRCLAVALLLLGGILGSSSIALRLLLSLNLLQSLQQQHQQGGQNSWCEALRTPALPSASGPGAAGQRLLMP
jgi:hypothetical protein